MENTAIERKLKQPQAFPIPLGDGSCYFGMTLRDWFAGQALAGLMTNPRAALPYGKTELTIEEAAYMAADAMLIERAKGSSDAT